MKFSKFREFRDLSGGIGEVVKYLTVDLVFSLRELYTGLSRLDFTENFEAFEVTVTVPAATSPVTNLAIRNQLDPVIPTGKIILRDGGSNGVVDGTLAWTKDYVYLQNLDASDVTVTVVFFK